MRWVLSPVSQLGTVRHRTESSPGALSGKPALGLLPSGGLRCSLVGVQVAPGPAWVSWAPPGPEVSAGLSQDAGVHLLHLGCGQLLCRLPFVLIFT